MALPQLSMSYDDALDDTGGTETFDTEDRLIEADMPIHMNNKSGENSSSTMESIENLSTPPRPLTDKSTTTCHALSPFSPLFKKNFSCESTEILPKLLMEGCSHVCFEIPEPVDLTLSHCRKVSVVVRVLAHGDTDQLCVFPFVERHSKDGSQSLNAAYDQASLHSPRELIVVNPTAFGQLIPSKITMETARLVSKVAKLSSEDWARSYSFHQVLWPNESSINIAGAIANDVTGKGSIACRTVLGMGPQSELNLFGRVAHATVAQIMSLSSLDEGIELNYGLLGITAAQIFSKASNVTVSVLEIHDQLHDLLAARPFLPTRKVTWVAGELRGLSDTPVADLRQLGRHVRRAISAAQHPKRKSPMGHVILSLKLWDSSNFENSERCTVVQFVNLASVVSENSTIPVYQDLARRNSRVRQSLTALGSVLRGTCLKEAGNESLISYRESTLTKVLQKSMDQFDSRMIIVAGIHALSSDYDQTLTTLRYVNRLLFKPGQVPRSPFDVIKTGNGAPSPIATDESTSFSLERYADPEGLLQNVVSDPRQRLARIFKSKPSTLEQVTDTTIDSYVPTSYKCVEPEDDRNDTAEMATPLFRNGPQESFDRDRFKIQVEDNMQSSCKSNLKQFAVDTTFTLDAMEEGHDVQPSDEPSPLTTDTGDSYNYGPNAMALLYSRIVESDTIVGAPEGNASTLTNDYTDPRNERDLDVPLSMDEQKIDDLSFELFHSVAVFATGGDNSALYLAEMKDLDRELVGDIHLNNGSISSLPIIGKEMIVYEEVNPTRFSVFESQQMREPQTRFDHIVKLSVHNKTPEELARDGSVEDLEAAREKAEMEARRVYDNLDRVAGRFQRELDSKEGELKKPNYTVVKTTKQLQQAQHAILLAASERKKAETDTLRVQHEFFVESDRLGHESSRQESQIKERQSSVERAIIHDSQSAEEAITVINEERTIAEKEARRVKQDMDFETEQYNCEIDRREAELRDFESKGKISAHRIQQLLQDEKLAELFTERDKAMTEVQLVRDDLQHEKELHQRRIDSKEQECRALRLHNERIKSDVKSKSTTIMELMAERDKFEYRTRETQHERDLETSKHRGELERCSSQFEGLEASVEKTNQRLLKSHNQSIIQLSSERDTAKKEFRRVREAMQAEIENQSSDTDQELSLLRSKTEIELEMAKGASALEIQCLSNENETKNEELYKVRQSLENLQSDTEMARQQYATEITNERTKAQQDTAVASATCEVHRKRFCDELNKNEAVVEELKLVFDRDRSQLQQSHDENIAVLNAERDQMKAEKINATRALQVETKRHERELKTFEDSIQLLEESVKSTKFQMKQSHDDLVTQIIADRDRAIVETKRIQEELDLESERIQVVLEERNSYVRQLEAIVEQVKVNDLQAVELKAQRDDAEKELSFSRKSLKIETQRSIDDRASQSEEIKELKGLLESLEAQLGSMSERLSAKDTELDEARRVNTGLELRYVELDRALKRRDKDLIQTTEILENLQKSTKESKDEAVARLLTELEDVEKKALKRATEFQREIDRYHRDAVARDEEIHELRSIARTTKRELKILQECSRRELSVERDRFSSQALILKDAAERERRVLREGAEMKEKEIVLLQADLKMSTADRAEALKIAEEAISTQAELESRVNELQRQISAQSAATIAIDAYNEIEATNAELLKELHEVRTEVFQYKSELNDTKMNLSAVQFTLESTEKERHQLQELHNSQEAETNRLKGQLAEALAASEGTMLLKEETKSLNDELDELTKSQWETEQRHKSQLDERTLIIASLEAQCNNLRNELSTVLEEQKADVKRHEVEIATLLAQLSETTQQHGDAQSQFRDYESNITILDEEKRSVSQQLEQTTLDLSRQVANVDELSSRLKQILDEKKDVEAAIEKMNASLSNFQADTRERVQKLVLHRNEATSLLDKSIDENKELSAKNEELQAKIRDLHYNSRDGMMLRNMSAITEQLSITEQKNCSLAESNRHLRCLFEEYLTREQHTQSSEHQKHTYHGGFDKTNRLRSLVSLDNGCRPEAFNDEPLDSEWREHETRPAKQQQQQHQHHYLSDLKKQQVLSEGNNSPHGSADWSRETNSIPKKTINTFKDESRRFLESPRQADIDDRNFESYIHEGSQSLAKDDDSRPDRRQRRAQVNAFRPKSRHNNVSIYTSHYRQLADERLQHEDDTTCLRARADDIAAYISLNAKKAVQSTIEEEEKLRVLLAQVKDTKDDEISHLKRRIEVLENQMDAGYAASTTLAEIEEEKEALKVRLGVLERRLIEVNTPQRIARREYDRSDS
jgi:hypothetical protein